MEMVKIGFIVDEYIFGVFNEKINTTMVYKTFVFLFNHKATLIS
jgi:hypothetical protein